MRITDFNIPHLIVGAMVIRQKHYDSIKAHFENDEGCMLSSQLSENQYLVRQFLTDYPNEMDYSFQAKIFEWKEFSHFQLERDVIKVKTSLHTVGDLIFYLQGRESNRKEISLKLLIEVPCLYVPDADFISFNPESVVVKTEELNTITMFDEIVLDEYNKLNNLKPLEFNTERIWQFNEPQSDVHDYISGHDFFSEIDNMYRQVRYSIALAKTYAHYANKYYTREERQPFLHYPLNFTSHDRRYLDFCTSAIHYMYVYWERLALLIFQYHQPPKVNAKNLSFVKLIENIFKEQAGTTVDLTWFKKFLVTEHAKIQLLRHPLVHFKLDPAKGSYIPMIQEKWIKNIKDKQHLLNMEANSKALIGEIINLAEKCYEGYEKALQLILELKSATAAGPPIKDFE